MMSEDLSFEIALCESILRKRIHYVEVMEMLAGYYTRSGSLHQGLDMDLRLVELQPENPTHHYNLACSFSLCGRLNEAISSLQTAVRLGYDDFIWMSNDPDLKELHALPEFHLLKNLC